MPQGLLLMICLISQAQQTSSFRLDVGPAWDPSFLPGKGTRVVHKIKSPFQKRLEATYV